MAAVRPMSRLSPVPGRWAVDGYGWTVRHPDL